MTFERELELHIRSSYPILYVLTPEETRAESEIAQVAARFEPPRKVRTWDFTDGFHDDEAGRRNPMQALEQIDKASSHQPTLFVLRDFHRFLDDVAVSRLLRNLAPALRESRKTVLIVSPVLHIPAELEEEITLLELRPPTFEAIDAELEALLSGQNMRVRLEPGAREMLIKACQGLTMGRIGLVVAKAIASYGQLDERAIALVLEEKKQRIRRTEILEFIPTTETLDDIGGLDILKAWLNRRASAFTEEARSYGLPNPRGILLVGIQGTGKSLSAKATAGLWQLPLLRLDVGRLMGALVGQSEARTRQAIQLAEAMSPCVLWVDEIEKAFAGLGGAPVGDSGTSARVLGTLITWMQEKTAPVFVAATANSIEALPPELLRKGRFDEIFFIGLPTESERREIFEVHLRKVRETRLRDFDLDRLAQVSEGYNGAEIEQSIIEAMHAAFGARREFTTADVAAALGSIVPLSRTMEEQIERLQHWAESGRARLATSEMEERVKALPTHRERTLRAEIGEAEMPLEVEREARRELERMVGLSNADPERSWIRTYLDWLLHLPWNKATEDNLDLAYVRAVLDADHYGLTDVKTRIVEYLAVRKLRIERGGGMARRAEAVDGRYGGAGTILCFVGPPGVGKTSLGESIARAMGRKFARFSLGGVRDEAEIRGFRRTYVGAGPGRFIQTLRRVGVRNPVLMLDEIDKVGSDFRGDPAAALLEALDPEQNRDFRDHYLEAPFDLSEVLFICTANDVDTIPRALRDRMEVIRLSGYTEYEKVHIARGYLVPRQLRENGLRPDEVRFTDAALSRIIRAHTLEPGVRELERQIGRLCRKISTRVAETGRGATPVAIDAAAVEAHLGPGTQYLTEVRERTRVPGVAIALAAVPGGGLGDVLFIEATQMPGGRGFNVTGQLGDVARESAFAALSYVRARARELGLPPDFFDRHDLHLHMPAGAQPKDGPSAGVAIVTALVSLVSGLPVKPNVAMTGEITLRGQVLSVSGIKEKALAAHRVGLNTVILPRVDAHQLEEVPEELRQEMQFVLVDRVEQALAAALAQRADEKIGASQV